MKLPMAAGLVALILCAPSSAHDIWEPCIEGEPSMEGVIGAFQAAGWAFPSSNEEHVQNLQAAAEPLFSLQNIPNVSSGSEYDRHIAVTHDGAEEFLMDAATLQRDGLAVAIEYNDNAGGMIRCTIAGNDFEEVAYAFDGGGGDIRNVNGHEILDIAVPDAAKRTDVTLYRLLAPVDATVRARATFAAVAIRHLQ